MTRYSRHHLLPEIGPEGQNKLKNSKVLVVGAGGLGSPVLMYLAAAGVGTIGIIDGDQVELSNLQRQVLHNEHRLGLNKAVSAQKFLSDLNSENTYIPMETRLTQDNAKKIISNYDLIVDATDNFATRYLINDVCVELSRPVVSASILKFEGQLTIFNLNGGPCLRCIYSKPPPADLRENCGDTGVLGVLPGVMGSLQATEALKILLSIGQPLVGRLLTFDALAGQFKEFQFQKNSLCKGCGKQRKSFLEDPSIPEIDGSEISLSSDDAFFLDVRTPEEYALVNLGWINIPLSKLRENANEIPRNKTVYILCHKGKRSLAAGELLRSLGFTRIISIRGGIDSWATIIDPKILRY